MRNHSLPSSLPLFLSHLSISPRLIRQAKFFSDCAYITTLSSLHLSTIFQLSQKIKIMFRVFQVVSLGFSWNSSKFQNLHRKEARNFPMFLRLYKELEPINGWRARNFSKFPGIYTIDDDTHLQVPDPIHGVILRIFLALPKAYCYK